MDKYNKQQVEELVNKANLSFGDPNEEEKDFYIDIEVLGVCYELDQVELFEALDEVGKYFYLIRAFPFFSHEKGTSQFDILIDPKEFVKLLQNNELSER